MVLPFVYGYDQNDNRLYRDNLVDNDFDELYHENGDTKGYDKLNQMVEFRRGPLSDTSNPTDSIPDTVTTASRYQNWTLDAMGNWDAVNSSSGNQSRTHNRQNQVTQTGSDSFTFDTNGNTTQFKDGTTKSLTYDAWNRPIQITGGASTVTYIYDAVGRRIKETRGVTTTDLYYSDDWQVLEEKVGTATRAHYVWSPIYVDALILRDNYNVSGEDFGGGDSSDEDGGGGSGEDFGGGGSFDERYYVQQDANWNVTALIDATANSPTFGQVVERYVYDPYGQPTFLDGSWGSRSSSSYDWIYLHQGGRYDTVVNLYNFRNRDLSPALGRWLQTDPLSYAAGDTNLYRDVFNNPANYLDPQGLATCGDNCDNGEESGGGGDGGGESGDDTSSGPALPSWIPEAEEERLDDSGAKRPDEDKEIRRNWPRLPYFIGPREGPPQEEVDKKYRVEPGQIDYACYVLFRIPSCGYQGGFNRPPPRVIGPENFYCVPCIPGSIWRFKPDGGFSVFEYWPPNFVGPLPPLRPGWREELLEPEKFFSFGNEDVEAGGMEGKRFEETFPKGTFPRNEIPPALGGFYVSPIWPYLPKTPPPYKR